MKFGEILPKIKEDDNWHGCVFSKKFHYELDYQNQSEFTPQDRLDQLKKMYEEAKEMPLSFQSHILLEILVYGRKLDICHKQFFADYLSMPASTHCLSEEKIGLAQYNENWSRYYQVLSGRSDVSYISDEFHFELMYYYLEAFYRADIDITQFQKHFRKDDYKKMVNMIKFLNGEEISHESMTSGDYDKLGTEVMIDILQSNPKSYKVNDKIKILCDLKNTPTVYIKIYEFNAENYYRNKLSQFNDQINLDGLEPLFERTEEFKESPQKKFRHMFEIPEIHQKAGLFVIDFISNGTSSRAVIKKGSLSLVYKSARDGLHCFICDDEKQICKDDTTAIWFSNKYYKANEEGKIMIPYSKTYNYSTAVLLHQGISDISSLNQSTEEYYLS